MNPRNIQHGAVAGIAGGIVFGAMMGMMGMLPMIGQMVGSPTAGAGFLVHIAISALIGASFGLIFHSRVHGTGSGFGYGALYGGVWWILGPLTLMPLMMGMGLGVNWNSAAAAAMLAKPRRTPHLRIDPGLYLCLARTPRESGGDGRPGSLAHRLISTAQLPERTEAECRSGRVRSRNRNSVSVSGLPVPMRRDGTRRVWVPAASLAQRSACATVQA